MTTATKPKKSKPRYDKRGMLVGKGKPKVIARRKDEHGRTIKTFQYPDGTVDTPFLPPHRVWNTPLNDRLGKLLLQLDDARIAVDAFLDAEAFPAAMLRQVDDLPDRLKVMAMVLLDNLCSIGCARDVTDAEHAAYRRRLAGKRARRVFHW